MHPRITPKIIVLSLLSAVTLVTLLLFFMIRLDVEGDFEGLFILKGTGGKLLEVKDDVLLGEYERLLFRIDLPWLHSLIYHDQPYPTPSEPYSTLTWNSRAGHGFIQSYSPDSTRFLISFSRFHDSNGAVPRGLFVGGGLPYSRYEGNTPLLNETGVAYYNGTRWYHIWCNANEAIAGGNSPEKLQFPSTWKFLGSKVHYETREKIILQSSHETLLDGVPVKIDRFVIYRSGERHFILANRIRNTGNTPTSYFFVYGDEPWLGDYGTSAGNVGWASDRLFYYESLVDPQRYSYAGMFDIGNPVVMGETGNYSKLSNFIEWLGDIRPDLVYFSNKEGKISEEAAHVPLSSRDNRVIFAQWGPRTLVPGQSETILLAIGMGSTTPASTLPMKPSVMVEWPDLHYIITGN